MNRPTVRAFSSMILLLTSTAGCAANGPGGASPGRDAAVPDAATTDPARSDAATHDAAGSTVFANLTPPAWPAEITLDVAATITVPTYTSTPALVYYDYYKNAELVPYRVANTVPIHTPRSSEGIVVGDSLRIVARAIYGGVEYPGVSSAAGVVQAAGGVGSEPLAQIPYSAASPTIDGVDSDYDGVHDLVWNGNVMLGPVLDPNGSGRTVNLHRIMQDAPYGWGTTHRCELLYGETDQRLPPGVDTWQAFAVMRKVGESLPENAPAMLVFQSHSPESGDTYPPYSLVMKRDGADELQWYASYNTRPPSDWEWNGGAFPTVEDEVVVHAEPLMPEGEWYRYVVHYRAGYLAEHEPLLEVWRAKPGEAYEKLFAHTGFNAYNGGDGYPRIGIYKWDADWVGQSSLAFYMSPLYYGRGADLYDQGVAALTGL